MTTSTPEPEPATFRVRCAEDFLALAPVVIGFAPERSIVMLTFGGRRTFHARVDLPPRRELTAPTAAALADLLVRPAVQHHVRSVVLLFYTPDDGAATRAHRALRRAVGAVGIDLLEALRVDDHRYFPLLAADRHLRECGVAYDVGDHPFAARAVVAGRVVHPSRAAMAAQLDPVAPAVAQVEQALARLGHRRAPATPSGIEARLAAGERVERLVAGHVAAGTTATDEEVAELVRLVRDPGLRGAATARLRRANARAHVGFWLDVVRRTPDRLVPAPAALAGWAAWLAGDGALAWAAVDRCRAVAVDHPLAGLLAHALEEALPPELGEPHGDWRAGIVAGPPGEAAPGGPVSA